MILKNPEFKKNIKLEFSNARILIPIVILLLGSWIAWISGTPNGPKNSLPFYANAISLTSWMFGFGFIFSIVWGSHLASNSLLGEMRQKTWDFMRMSSLPPEQMLIGKLFGAPATVWAISLAAIFPIIAYCAYYLFPNGGTNLSTTGILFTLFCALFSWIIFSYSFVMLVGIYTYSKESKHTAIRAVLLNMLLGLAIGGMITSAYGQEYASLQRSGNLLGISSWYGFEFFSLGMAALVITYAAVWTLIGLYRTFRSALQYRDSPAIWPIFLITSTIFLNGFGYNENRNYYLFQTYLAAGFALSLIIVCYKDAFNIVGYKKLFAAIKAKDYKESFRLTPLYIISFLVFILGAPILFFTSGQLGRYDALQIDQTTSFFAFYASLILLIARDIIAFHLIAWRKKSKSPTVGFVVYLLLSYILVPLAIAKATAGTQSVAYFLPILNNGAASVNPLGIISVQLALLLTAVLFLKRKWDYQESLK